MTIALRRSLYGLCFLLLLCMALSAIVHGVRDNAVMGFAGVAGVLIAVAVSALGASLATIVHRRGRRLYLVFLVLLSGTICLFWNLYAQTVPVSDYQVLLQGATAIARGTFTEGADKTSYFYIYNFQIGVAAYLGLIVKLLSDNLTSLKLAEALYLIGSALMLYVLVATAMSASVAAVAAALYATLIVVFTGSSIINNQHASLLLLLIGLYLVLKGAMWHVIAAGVVFGVMNLIRPIGAVTVAAVCLYFLYQMGTAGRRRQWAVRIPLLAAAFLLAVWAFDIALVHTGIAPDPVSQSHLPYFKVVIGLDDNHGSLFGHETVDARKTSVYFDLQQLGFDYKGYNDAQAQYILQRARDYGSTLSYVARKMWYFVGEKDNQYVFALNGNKLSQRPLIALINVGQAQYVLLLLAALVTVSVRLKRSDDGSALFAILLLTFILAHIPVEAQPRYRYEAYIFVVIFAAESIYHLVEKASQIRRRDPASP